MTKSKLIEAVAEANNIPRTVAGRIVSAMFDEMSEALLRGERIEFRGFGSFHVRSYESYVARNPRTGEQASVPSRRRIRFRSSEILTSRLNHQFQ